LLAKTVPTQMITDTPSSGTLRLRTSPASRDTRGVATESPVRHATAASTPSTTSGVNGPSATGANAQPVLESDALLQGRTHVNIVHNGETYQLRATRLGKLILTK
jgi:hemin uptake protein HemP